MVNYGFLKKLMVVGERQLLREVVKYVDLAEKANSLLIPAMDGSSGNIEKANTEIRALEKQADETTMSLKHEITNGAISSTLMNSLFTLVENCDTLLDLSYFAIREMKRMMAPFGGFKESERSFIFREYGKFARMLDINQDALKSLRNMLISESTEQMGVYRRQIEDKEERVDELKDEIIDELYRNSASIGYLTFSHLTDMVHKIDDLLDDCEDIADTVFTIITSLTK